MVHVDYVNHRIIALVNVNKWRVLAILWRNGLGKNQAKMLDGVHCGKV